MLLETPNVEQGVPLAPLDQARSVWRVLNWRPLAEYGALLIQLALLAILIWRYRLESPAFMDLTLLAFAGFGVHYWLPRAYRLPFFLLLSLAGIVLVLDWQAAAWLVGLGVLLIAVCHLPLGFWTRVALLVGLGGLLMVMRAGWVATPLPLAVWPLLGSMFMFRLMVYMYDLKHATAPVSPITSLSYFFLLPNVCFPLFPVVDYQTFCRNYYDDEPNRIHQVGVRWIFRGVLHLILYRIIYKNYSISQYDVANAGDIVHYCVWLFLLYLRVSGQFHIIVGILRLYGFNLPETHKLYYLSSSFTDFWRRINIYWKDFMMKLFFYPTYFRLKKQKPVVALVVSTVIVFFLTWLLHAVQWFWLRGTFLFTASDTLFWTILAGLVVVNSVWEFTRGRQRTTAQGQVSWSKSLLVAVKTLATFMVICLLWSLWSSGTVSGWLTLWQFALVPPTAGGWLLIAAVVAAILGGALLVARNPAGLRWSQLSFMQEAVARSAVMVFLCAISIHAVHRQLGPLSPLLLSAKAPGLNVLEMADLERGYYEDLLDVHRFNGELWTLYLRRPPEWQIDIVSAGLAERTSNLLQFKLKPSAQGKYKGVNVHTNSWGMHDDECSRQRTPGEYRIALLGASHVMALGVGPDEDFETLAEVRLNKENTGEKYSRYEILNFAVAGYTPLSQISVLRDKVFAFEPDAVFYVGHAGDTSRVTYHLLHAIQNGLPLDDPYLQELVHRMGVDRQTPEPIIRRQLASHGEELLSWIMERLADLCKSHGIRPIFIVLPETGTPPDAQLEIRLAQRFGFTVLDLSDVYAGHVRKSISIADWDQHPNPLGHRLIAEKLCEMLRRTNAIPLSSGSQALKH